MPGELDRKADGSGAMFSVNDTPWHREGTVLTSPPRNVADALRVAGLNFSVELRRLYCKHPQGVAPVDDYYATVRTDTNAVLGVVGLQYTPLQNEAAFSVLQPLLDSERAFFETAGSLRGGRDIWALVRFRADDPVIQEVFTDEVVPFGLLSNNHAGERGVVLQDTPIRVVCMNTLGSAHASAVRGRVLRVRHTYRVGVRTVEAAEALWGGLIERLRNAAAQYKQLKAVTLSDEEFGASVLDVVAPLPAAPGTGKRSQPYEKAAARAETRRRRLQHLWLKGKGHDGRPTAWAAYNAVVEALDHDDVLWPTRGSRVQALMDGSLGAKKSQVLDGLYELAREGRR